MSPPLWTLYLFLAVCSRQLAPRHLLAARCPHLCGPDGQAAAAGRDRVEGSAAACAGEDGPSSWAQFFWGMRRWWLYIMDALNCSLKNVFFFLPVLGIEPWPRGC